MSWSPSPMNEIVLFDSWAWWEVLEETPAGRVLSERYLEARRVRVLTVDYTLAEVAAKLARIDRVQDIEGALDAISTAGMVPITPEIAALAAALQAGRRKESG